jgi:CRISPR-associated protein Csb2
MIFDRFPRDLWSEEAEQLTATACERIGLPRPSRADIVEVSPILGVPPSPHFPTLSTEGKAILPSFASGRHRIRPSGHTPRLRAHLVLEFGELVGGPLIIGAGRYRGMGLCHAWRRR